MNKRPQTPNEVLAEVENRKAEEAPEESSPENKEKERTYVDILRDKIRVLSLIVPSDVPGPTDLYFKRWSYGVSVDLAPMALGIIANVFSSIAPLINNKTVNINDAIESILGGSSIVPSIGKHMKDISMIIARTLITHSENKITDVNAALKFVNGLDPADVIAICKLLFSQNFGHLGKNELGLTLEKTGVSEK